MVARAESPAWRMAEASTLRSGIVSCEMKIHAAYKVTRGPSIRSHPRVDKRAE